MTYRHSKKDRPKTVLVISDLHFPSQHPDACDFLDAVRRMYPVDMVIGIGDIVDNHTLSFHERNPDIPGGKAEVDMSVKGLKKLYKMFPEMHLVYGNHDLLPYRQARSKGISDYWIKTMGDVLKSPPGWEWHSDMYLTLPNGADLYIAHDTGRSIKKAVSMYGCNVVSGHYHSKFKISYRANKYDLYWGMQVGSLVNESSVTFDYMRNTSGTRRGEKFILGCGLIHESQPYLIPMVVNNKGRWIGKL